MDKPQIVIVGAHGAMGGHSLLKLYGNENLSVLILPSEVEAFTKKKVMAEDQWFPADHTVIPDNAFVIGREPTSPTEVGVYSTETIPAGFFKGDGVVLIASKIFHYPSVIETIKPILSKDTLIFNLVNGLKPELTLERICREKGVHNSVARAVVMGGTHHTIDDQACRVHSGIAKFVIGKWDREHTSEYQYQLEKIAGLYSQDILTVEPQYGNDFRRLSFDKVLANLVNPISAFTGCTTIEYVTHKTNHDIIIECFNQGIDVGLAIGLDFHDREKTIKDKLEMYEKAGKSAKAHLPSMGQDSLRAILNRTILSHENEHIGVALVNEGLGANTTYHASLIDDFNRILDLTTERYNQIYSQDKESAAQFLIELMMRNRYSLGLKPNNRPLYEQFEGLEELESRITINWGKLKPIKNINEAAVVFQENLEGMIKSK